MLFLSLKCVYDSAYIYPAAGMEEGLLGEEVASLSANCTVFHLFPLWPLRSVTRPRKEALH